MRGPRWFALATLVAGLVIATYGAVSPWIGIPHGHVSDSPETLGVSAWLIDTPLIVGVVFAMLVGARRNYLPPPLLPALIAAMSAGGLAVTGFATHRMYQFKTVEVLDPRTYHLDVVPMSVSIAPWVELVGMAILTGAGTWLWWIARSAKLRAARDLARVDHELAVRQADLLPETPPTVPRL